MNQFIATTFGTYQHSDGTLISASPDGANVLVVQRSSGYTAALVETTAQWLTRHDNMLVAGMVRV